MPTASEYEYAIALYQLYVAELEGKVAALAARVEELTKPVEPPPPPPVEPPSVGFSVLLEPPAGKMLLGTSLPTGSLAMFKSATGGKLPHIGHEYATSGSSFKARLADAEVKGTIPLINFKPGGQNGPAEYKTILAGGRNTDIDAAADAAKAYRKKFLFAPLHEPENDDSTGAGDADYAKAFRYIVDRFAARGALNAISVWNMMGFDQHIPRYKALYPGDAHVDWIGGDPYSHSTTKTLPLLGKKFYDAMKYTGKPFMWCEWGFDKPTITAKPDLVSPAELTKMMAAMPLLKALVYWNQWKDQAAGDGKNYLISNFSTQFGKFAAAPQFDFKVPAELVA